MTTPYCTIADVTKYIGACAMPQVTSGDPTSAAVTDDDFVDFAIEAVDAEIDSYLVDHYSLTVTHASASIWLRHCSAIMAAVWIFRAGQNGTVPPGLQAWFDERIAALKEISQGKRQIPEVGVKADPGVSMSNLRHDQRPADKKIRTMPWLNTGDQNSTNVRSLDLSPPFEL